MDFVVVFNFLESLCYYFLMWSSEYCETGIRSELTWKPNASCGAEPAFLNHNYWFFQIRAQWSGQVLDSNSPCYPAEYSSTS